MFKILLKTLMLSVSFVTSSIIKCERIIAPACQGLGYNMTAMPNLAGHNNQIDADLMVSFKSFVI